MKSLIKQIRKNNVPTDYIAGSLYECKENETIHELTVKETKELIKKHSNDYCEAVNANLYDTDKVEYKRLQRLANSINYLTRLHT